LTSAIGYVLTFSLLCDNNQHQHDSFISRITNGWCVEYHDGTLHNVGAFELLVLGTCLLAILGYLRASHLHHQLGRHDELMHHQEDLLLQEEEDSANDPTVETTTTNTASSSISSSTMRRK
jgi:hypothetical protein